MSRALVALLVCIGAGCAGNTSPPEQPASPPREVTTDVNAPAVRTKLTPEECKAKGTLVGDVGDGATQRESYRCPDGKVPIGNVPLGVEGSVCCGR